MKNTKQINKKWEMPTMPSDVDRAFPASVIGTYLPEMVDIPEEFRSNWHSEKHCDKAQSLFFSGGSVNWRDGIDPSAANAHLSVALGSFEPKHEHKIAGCGYLLSLWAEV